MTSAITSIGVATPPHRFSQQQAAQYVAREMQLSEKKTAWLERVFEATGIKYSYSFSDAIHRAPQTENSAGNTESLVTTLSTSHRMRLYQKEAISLAARAADNCLLGSKHTGKGEITHLIAVSCTGLYAPGLDIDLIKHLGLNTSVKRTAVNFMGCCAAYNALRVADSICRADKNARVLVVCVELCTLHFQNNNKKDGIVSFSLFGDGAGAVLVEGVKSETKSLLLDSFYNEIADNSSNCMTWEIGQTGFSMHLSTSIPDIIENNIAEFIARSLKQGEYRLSDIDYFAFHPGGPQILEKCEVALKLEKDANRYAYRILRSYGNMSSPTSLFVLNEIWNELVEEDSGKIIFGAAFGPGLSMESGIFRISSA